MNSHQIALRVFLWFSLSGFAFAERFCFERLVGMYPHSAIITFKKGKPNIVKVIYSDDKKSFPTVSVPDNSGFDGEYLVFLPDAKKVAIHELFSFAVIDDKVNIFEDRTEIFPLKGREIGRISRPVLKDSISIVDLLNKLTLLNARKKIAPP